jgi:tRNA A-37 threonylcarbamoyl transferase component Bud32
LNAVRKKLRQPEIHVTWVFDFFLAHLTNTRENVLTGSALPAGSTPTATGGSTRNLEAKTEDHAAAPKPAQRPTLAQERTDQYVNLKRSVGKLAATVKDDDDPDNGPEVTEGIDLQGATEEEKKHVTIEDFELLKVLGRGAFGKVMQAKKKDTGKIYAIKVLKKSMVYQRKQVAHTQAERRILEVAQHPFLMGLRFAFQSDTKLYLVMDFYSGGELFFHLKKKKKFSEEEARTVVAEVALALGHLHKNNFIYRDLKPENVLLHETGHVCVTDFGLSKALEADQKDTRTMCGTPEYLRKCILC